MRKEIILKKIERFIISLFEKIKGLLYIAFGLGVFYLFIKLVYFFFRFQIIDNLKDVPYLYQTIQYFTVEISKGTPLGMIYIFFFASLFFIPAPTEAIFYNYIKNGAEPSSLFLFSLVGILLGQIFNFASGYFFKFIFISSVKKRTRIKFKAWLSKYGVMLILFMHMVPSPYQVFNLVIGTVRYPFFRWLFFAFIGILFKNLIMLYLIK